jgi:hypothetical protein
MKKIWIGALAVAVLLALLLGAGDAGYWRRYLFALTDGSAQGAANLVQPRLRLAGSDAPLPHATAEAELIAPEALTAAADAARAAGAQALIVHRHGHRVFEYFAAGRSGVDAVEGGELSAAPLALAAGALVDSRRIDAAAAVEALRTATRPGQSWRNPWSAAARQRFKLAAPPALLRQDMDADLATTISGRVWLPLRAADAWLWGTGDAQLRLDCCMVARVDDWMRIGDLLLQQGRYQGERIVSPDWIRQLLAADVEGARHPVWLGVQQTWTGDEPPAARDVYWFDLGTDLRLWLMPRRSLAVLHWAGNASAHDTMLPNIILRGLLDQAPVLDGSTELNELVPGH